MITRRFILRNFSYLTFFAAAHLHAQSTAFTYQGNLSSGGSPANGSYDFAFTLYANVTNGIPTAGPITNSATPVSNGLFIASIDFGAGVFNGSNYWLDIAVRTNGSPNFTELTPRQPVMPTPYAILATTANNLNGTIGSSNLPTSPNFSGTVTAGSFSGNGSGLTNVGWPNISSTPTTLAGYGITNAQPTNANLTALSANNGNNLTNLNATNLVGNIPSATLNNSGAVTTGGPNQNIVQTPTFQNGFVAQNIGSPYYEANFAYFGSSASPILWAAGNPNLTNAGMNPQVSVGTPNVWGSGAGINWLFPMLCNLTNAGQFYCVFTNYLGAVTTNLLTPVITNVNNTIVGYNLDFSPSMNLNGPFGVQGDSPDAIEIINNGNLLTKISTVGAVQDETYTNGQVVTLPNGSTFTYEYGISGNYPFFIADPVGFYGHGHVYLGSKVEPGAFNNHATNWQSGIDVDCLNGITTMAQGAIASNFLRTANITIGLGNPNNYGGAGTLITTNVSGETLLDGAQLSPRSVLTVDHIILNNTGTGISLDILGNGTGLGAASGSMGIFAAGIRTFTVFNNNSPTGTSQLRMEGTGTQIAFNGNGQILGNGPGDSHNPAVYSGNISNNAGIYTASITATNVLIIGTNNNFTALASAITNGQSGILTSNISSSANATYLITSRPNATNWTATLLGVSP